MQSVRVAYAVVRTSLAGHVMFLIIPDLGPSKRHHYPLHNNNNNNLVLCPCSDCLFLLEVFGYVPLRCIGNHAGINTDELGPPVLNGLNNSFKSREWGSTGQLDPCNPEVVYSIYSKFILSGSTDLHGLHRLT